ncbi:unnamed protein product, partial [Pylaiella littoralis]
MSRLSSVGLQRDVDEVVSMVGLLHGRLSDAACWTRNLQEDTQASREKVAGVMAQVRQLAQGILPAANADVEGRQSLTTSGSRRAGSNDGQNYRSVPQSLSSRHSEISDRNHDGAGGHTNGTSSVRSSRHVSPLSS